MQEVILHIGTHKTGTTSIQESLSGFDDGKTLYSSIGINHSVPIFTIFSNGYKEHHIWKRVGLSAEEVDTKKNEFVRALKNDLSRSDRERLVISGEDISELNADEKRSLLEFFRSFDVDVRIICYVRNPIGLMTSSFQELLKQNRPLPDRFCPDYVRKIKPFLEMIPHEKIRVKEFEPTKLYKGDVVYDFCNEIGIEIADSKVIRSNESLTADAAKLIWRFNNLPICSTGSEELFHARNSFLNMIQAAYAKGSRMKPENFILHLDCPQSEVDFLRDNFGITFEMPAMKQVQDLEDYLSDLSDVDIELLDNLLVKQDFEASAHKSVDERLIALFYGVLRPSKRILEYYKADAMSRHSRLARWLDLTDYKTHLLISKIPFVSEKTRKKFRDAAASRKSPRYRQ